jgi:hypothetical protein
MNDGRGSMAIPLTRTMPVVAYHRRMGWVGEKKSEELFTALRGESDHISRARGVRRQTGTYGMGLYIWIGTRCAHMDIKTVGYYRADAVIVSESLTVTTLATPRH